MKLGVIGCGKMGTALVAGAIRSGAIASDQVTGYDPFPAASLAFADATGGRTVDHLDELSDCDTFLLCTKPHHASEALAQLKLKQDALLISIAAGLTLNTLEYQAPDGCRVIRCMPNTPALVGEGAAAFAVGTRATEADADIAGKLLGSVGMAQEVPEALMDVVTGLSGSGPAFVFLMIEALADGGVRNGLPRAQALQLAAQTVKGAAKMVLETGHHPGELKDQVTSPGGTTIAGISELEDAGLRSALIRAVTASTNRSKELGKA